jgi:hypothetical protein
MKAINKAVIFASRKPICNYIFMAILAMSTSSFFVPGKPVIHYNDLCIYKNPDCKGDFTSSMAENKFQNPDLTGKLFCVDSAAFNNIIDHAHKRKYSPVKLVAADRFLFCFGHYNNKQHQILIANKGLIIDYTERVTFIIDRKEDTVYLKNLINWVYQ